MYTMMVVLLLVGMLAAPGTNKSLAAQRAFQGGVGVEIDSSDPVPRARRFKFRATEVPFEIEHPASKDFNML